MNEKATVSKWVDEGLEFLGHCPICGSSDRTKLYDKLHDRLFGAPGHWTFYQCRECASGYLDPRPTPETISLAYACYATHDENQLEDENKLQGLKRLRVAMRNDYLSRRYAYRRSPTVPWGHLAMYFLPPPLRLEWDHYARHLPRPKPGHNRLLDVGCGNGDFLLRARQTGWDVQGIDFDPQAAAIAIEKGLDVWTGDYRDAPYQYEMFDVITTNQVLEHVHSVPDFISHLVAWLRPGGALWIGTPNFTSLGRALFGANWKLLHPPQHLAILSSRALLDQLRDHGLSARLYRRGFFESHMLAESLALKNGYETYAKIEVTKKDYYKPVIGGLMDFLVWLYPRAGSDMVAVARKS